MVDRKHVRIGMVLLAVFGLAACEVDPKSGRAFTLPEGDVALGEAAFKRLDCVACHNIAGVEGLRDGVGTPVMTVVLGGTKMRTYTYGELVTSIINPSHKISQRYLGEAVESEGASAMRNYNDIMTVSDLVNITTFLQTHYELEPYRQTPYAGYGGGGQP